MPVHDGYVQYICTCIVSVSCVSVDTGGVGIRAKHRFTYYLLHRLISVSKVVFSLHKAPHIVEQRPYSTFISLVMYDTSLPDL